MRACACCIPTLAGQGCGESGCAASPSSPTGGQRLSCLTARGNLMRGSCVRAGPGCACVGVRAVGRLGASRAPHRRRPRRAIGGDQRVDETRRGSRSTRVYFGSQLDPKGTPGSPALTVTLARTDRSCSCPHSAHAPIGEELRHVHNPTDRGEPGGITITNASRAPDERCEVPARGVIAKRRRTHSVRPPSTHGVWREA